MPRLPVKKLRKQLKLLLLLVLLTFAVWFTYLHISLVRQGRALRLPFAYGRGNGAGGGRPPPQPGAAPGGPSRPITPRCGVSVEFGPPQGWWVPPAALGFQSIPQRRRHPAPAGEGPPSQRQLSAAIARAGLGTAGPRGGHLGTGPGDAPSGLG